ncbi:GntR family transcriptional regulator [Amycolatopsis sp.]|uniref:GntR family transcriptional regulator n=1 Tax=Amycolatopsis sp. TaxID=37632 RepID=UPI002C0E0B32|nr:GntR family transcriptional regulator [Amycolatopsis sp.]HVV13637.1 GntR family transcriptional regulator [Amycolatopsis sp.]
MTRAAQKTSPVPPVSAAHLAELVGPSWRSGDRRRVAADLASALTDVIRLRLPSGTTLPPLRNLAVTLRCNRKAVASAMHQLAEEGIVVTRARGRTRVV